METTNIDSGIKLSDFSDSRRATASRGWILLYTGSCGRGKSADSFSQVIGGKVFRGLTFRRIMVISDR